MMSNKLRIPAQPKVTETATGNFHINPAELKQFDQDMDAAHAQWKQAMQGAEMDPDELTRRMFALFTK